MSERMAFLIDTRFCNDCKTCEIACKMERRLDIGLRWRKMRKLTIEDPSTTDVMGGNKHKVVNVAMACNHCRNPKCVEICPMYAYTKHPNGIVQHDGDLCIACTRCVSACPYNAPVFNKSKSIIGKCDMCFDRINKGMAPACVFACPNGALKVGEYNDLVATYGANNDLKVLGDTSVVPDGDITNPSIIIVLES